MLCCVFTCVAIASCCFDCSPSTSACPVRFAAVQSFLLSASEALSPLVTCPSSSPSPLPSAASSALPFPPFARSFCLLCLRRASFFGRWSHWLCLLALCLCLCRCSAFALWCILVWRLNFFCSCCFRRCCCCCCCCVCNLCSADVWPVPCCCPFPPSTPPLLYVCECVLCVLAFDSI